MGKIALFFIIVMASATFYLTSSIYKSPTSTEKSQQRTWIDDSGKLHVMGIVLGESTVRDAERAFRSRVDAAIFMYPLASQDKENKFKLELEAYFPSIADHSKVMLKLAVDDPTMEEMRKRGTSPRMYPNGVARSNLSSEDILTVQKTTIKELVIMPSAQITDEIIHAQFGKPDHIEKDKGDMITTYTFKSIGLVAVINNEGKDKLTFRNPL
ncbi:MAG: hypothetical protein R8M46_05980 [Ghiorsea sp.]